MHILLPVDGTELSLDAVHHALSLHAQGLQMSVVLANVQDAPHLYEVVLAPDPATLDRAAEGAGVHALQAALALVQAAGVPCTTEVAHGDPARVLVEIAERHGCEAIILGTGQAGLLNPGRLGSVAQAVLHHASVPVTVVRHTDAED